MKCKKRNITLIEIMIVIFLIGLIGSVIGYNMKGSLDKGKVFRTEQGMKQVKDILLLQVAEGEDIRLVAKNPHKYLDASGLVQDPKTLLKDGWGKELVINLNEEETNLIVESIGLAKYNKKPFPVQQEIELDDEEMYSEEG